jgi:hypothetical protein
MTREPGELDMAQVDEIHNHLLADSAMYRYAFENKFVGLVACLQWKEAERRLAANPRSLPVSISNVTLDFLEQQLRYQIREFLDDPDGMTGNDVNQIEEIYITLTCVAADLDENFWDIAKEEECTDNEMHRLLEFLKQGKNSLDDLGVPAWVREIKP